MTSLVNTPAAALFCLACALVSVPAPATRRRRHQLLHRTGVRIPVRPNLFHAGVLACAAPALFAGLHSVIASAILLTTLTIRRRRGSRAQRHQRECQHLLDGLEILIAELRVGAHPSAAAEAAAMECAFLPVSSAAEAAEPPAAPLQTTAQARRWFQPAQQPQANVAAQAFAAAAARARLGGNAADGLLNVAASPAQLLSTELRRIASAWQLADAHGLALAELLTAAREDLLGRMRFRGRTQAALAGARASAAVLAGLPLLGIGLGQLMGAAPLRVLTGPGPGGALLVLGTGFACAGLLWTDAITGKVLS